MFRKRILQKQAVNISGLIIDKYTIHNNGKTRYVIKYIYNYSNSGCSTLLVEGYLKSNSNKYIPTELVTLITLFYNSYHDYKNSVIDTYDGLSDNEWDAINIGEPIEILCDPIHPQLNHFPKRALEDKKGAKFRIKQTATSVLILMGLIIAVLICDTVIHCVSGAGMEFYMYVINIITIFVTDGFLAFFLFTLYWRFWVLRKLKANDSSHKKYKQMIENEQFHPNKEMTCLELLVTDVNE